MGRLLHHVLGAQVAVRPTRVKDGCASDLQATECWAVGVISPRNLTASQNLHRCFGPDEQSPER